MISTIIAIQASSYIGKVEEKTRNKLFSARNIFE